MLKTFSEPRQAGPVSPCGLNHLVINVRDMEESHKFWTEIIGFTQVGELKGRGDLKMRFYSGVRDGKMNHHDLALVESKTLAKASGKWTMTNRDGMAINHIAVTLPSREAWLNQLAYLQDKGVTFNRRVNHGMTHSLYISDPNGYGVELLYELPREVWEGDIDAALNYLEVLPTEGEEALADSQDVPVFSN